MKEGKIGGIPGDVWQFPVEGCAAWDWYLHVLRDGLALHLFSTLSGWASRYGLAPWSNRHPVPGGVPPEWGLILTGSAFTIQLVFHHGNAVKLRTTSEIEGTNFKTFPLKNSNIVKSVTTIQNVQLKLPSSFNVLLQQQDCWYKNSNNAGFIVTWIQNL